MTNTTMTILLFTLGSFIVWAIYKIAKRNAANTLGGHHRYREPSLDGSHEHDPHADLFSQKLQHTGGFGAGRGTSYAPTPITLQNGRYITLYVMARRKKNFDGYQLLQALSSAGLHYGKMSIYHCFADAPHNTKSLFHVAQATNPGTFDLTNIGSTRCAGLSFFLDIESQENPIAAFEKMLATARQVTSELKGQLQDSNHQTMTSEAIAAYRGLVQEKQPA